ncbi:MAG: S24/S26 family peptidase [Clostridia bacterium]|nr:S24/S26 family peptidase [Clostridia bacterium]
MNEPFLIEDVLEREGVYLCTTSGMSMYPMLRHRQDTVLVRKKNGRLKKYDVPLYRRGDSYVLHRIIRVLPDGGYDIRGDNCFNIEKAVPEECIIGYLDGFWRGSKEVNMNSVRYRIYSRCWVALHPLICAAKKLKIFVRRVLRRVFGRKKN